MRYLSDRLFVGTVLKLFLTNELRIALQLALHKNPFSLQGVSVFASNADSRGG